jgi:hypothetical protein
VDEDRPALALAWLTVKYTVNGMNSSSAASRGICLEQAIMKSDRARPDKQGSADTRTAAATTT